MNQKSGSQEKKDLPPEKAAGLEQLANSVTARVGWGQRVVSPWVQRWLQSGTSAKAASIDGSGRVRRTTLSVPLTTTLLNRVQRAADTSTIWQPNVGSINPRTVERFTEAIVHRFADSGVQRQTQPNEIQMADAPDLPLAGTPIEPELDSEPHAPQGNLPFTLEEVRQALAGKAGLPSQPASPAQTAAPQPPSRPVQRKTPQPQPKARRDASLPFTLAEVRAALEKPHFSKTPSEQKPRSAVDIQRSNQPGTQNRPRLYSKVEEVTTPAASTGPSLPPVAKPSAGDAPPQNIQSGDSGIKSPPKRSPVQRHPIERGAPHQPQKPSAAEPPGPPRSPTELPGPGRVESAESEPPDESESQQPTHQPGPAPDAGSQTPARQQPQPDEEMPLRRPATEVEPVQMPVQAETSEPVQRQADAPLPGQSETTEVPIQPEHQSDAPEGKKDSTQPQPPIQRRLDTEMPLRQPVSDDVEHVPSIPPITDTPAAPTADAAPSKSEPAPSSEPVIPPVPRDVEKPADSLTPAAPEPHQPAVEMPLRRPDSPPPAPDKPAQPADTTPPASTPVQRRPASEMPDPPPAATDESAVVQPARQNDTTADVPQTFQTPAQKKSAESPAATTEPVEQHQPVPTDKSTLEQHQPAPADDSMPDASSSQQQPDIELPLRRPAPPASGQPELRDTPDTAVSSPIPPVEQPRTQQPIPSPAKPLPPPEPRSIQPDQPGDSTHAEASPPSTVQRQPATDMPLRLPSPAPGQEPQADEKHIDLGQHIQARTASGSRLPLITPPPATPDKLTAGESATQMTILPQIQRKPDAAKDTDTSAQDAPGDYPLFNTAPGSPSKKSSGPSDLPLAPPIRIELSRAPNGRSTGDTDYTPTPASPVVQRRPEPSSPAPETASPATDTIQRVIDEPVTSTEPAESSEQSAPDLDKLARQILPIIKRKLAVERDRRPFR